MSKLEDLLPPTSVEALNKAGVKTVLEFLNLSLEDPQKLRRIIPDHDSERIAKDLKSKFLPQSESGSNWCCKSESYEIVPKFALESGGIYEIFGPAGVGKTQFCLTAAAKVLSKDRKCVYLDAKNDFRAERLREILTSKKICEEDKVQELTDKTFFKRVRNLDELDKVLDVSRKIEDLGLLIVDNIASLVLPLLDEETVISSVFEKVAGIISKLRRLSDSGEKGCTVIVTNNATKRPGENWRPSLGKIFSHAVCGSSRIFIDFKNEDRNSRFMRTKFGSDNNQEVKFKVHKTGLE